MTALLCEVCGSKLAEEQGGMYFSCKHCGVEQHWFHLHTDEENQRKLLISKEIVTMMPYHEPGGTTTWEASTLRHWLNGKFFESLPAHMKARVLEVTNENPHNPLNEAPDEPDTQDKVFLLSAVEILKYLKHDGLRMARHKGFNACWWLRTQGENPGFAARMNYRANPDPCGHGVAFKDGVRPALWLSL